MWNIVTLYVLFGVANWAAHILQCKTCRIAAINITVFFFEALVFTFAWPMYFHSIFVSKDEPTKTEENFAQALDRLRNEGKVFALKFEKNEGETDEQFQSRMISEAAYHMKERFRKEKGGA